jgi:hypothetical protein
MSMDPSRANIVDLLRYRQERGQRRLDFTGDSSGPRPVWAVVSPFRPLSAREVGHRERMVKFLAGQRRS